MSSNQQTYLGINLLSELGYDIKPFLGHFPFEMPQNDLKNPKMTSKTPKTPKWPQKPHFFINFRKFWPFFLGVSHLKIALFHDSPGVPREKTKKPPKSRFLGSFLPFLTKKSSKWLKKWHFLRNPFSGRLPFEMTPITLKKDTFWGIFYHFLSIFSRFFRAIFRAFAVWNALF